MAWPSRMARMRRADLRMIFITGCDDVVRDGSDL